MNEDATQTRRGGGTAPLRNVGGRPRTVNVDTQNANVNMTSGNGRGNRRGRGNGRGMESSTRGWGTGKRWRDAFSGCPPSLFGFGNWNGIGMFDGKNFIPSDMVI